MWDSIAVHTAAIRRDTIDKWGAITSSTDTTIRCHVTQKTRLVRDQQGREAVSSALVRVPSSQKEPLATDRFVYQGREHAIVALNSIDVLGITVGWEVSLA